MLLFGKTDGERYQPKRTLCVMSRRLTMFMTCRERETLFPILGPVACMLWCGFGSLLHMPIMYT